MTTDALLGLAALQPEEEPRPLLALRVPGEDGYDPHTDAPAVILYGATYIEDGKFAGKYQYGMFVVDAWLYIVDQAACSVCRGAKLVRVPSPKPNRKPWEHVIEGCSSCTMPAAAPAQGKLT